MKKAILALALIVAACGGGGGGDDSPIARAFDFFGRWLVSLQVTSNTCGINLPRTSGALFVEIDQAGNVVSVDSDGVLGDLSGLVDGESFSAAGVRPASVFVCPDLSAPSATTTILNYSGVNGNIVENVELSFFGTCSGFADQCEITFTGQAIRLSGQESGSGVTVQNFEVENTEPEIF